MSAPTQERGFTLLEMSIVLLIVALLAGGLLIGKNLVHNAELQSVLNDAAHYKNALKLFKEKYHEMPGDMPGATQLWGTDTDGPFPCLENNQSELPKVATCDGNGDGFIAGSGGSAVSQSLIGTPEWEAPRAWQHLSNASLIGGTYSGAGTTAGGTSWWIPGLNIPKSRLRNNGFTISYASPGTGTANEAYLGEYRHILVYGSTSATTYQRNLFVPGLTGSEALMLDQKIDDGKPGGGVIRPFTPVINANCASNGNPITAEYQTNTTGLTCALIFITGF